MKAAHKLGIHLASLFPCSEVAKVFCVSSHSRRRSPRSIFWLLAPKDTLEARCVVYATFCIHCVLLLRRNAEILASVVERIAIDVIRLALVALFEAKNH